MKLKRDGECLVLSRPGRDDVVAVPTNDVWDLFGELFGGEMADGDSTVIVDEPKAHRCEGPELWTGRMQFALLSGDMPAYDFVVTQVGDCARCWRAIAHWTLNLLAGNRAVAAGGTDAAAGYVLREIARLTTP
jgi:hypothetical protein